MLLEEPSFKNYQVYINSKGCEGNKIEVIEFKQNRMKVLYEGEGEQNHNIVSQVTSY